MKNILVFVITVLLIITLTACTSSPGTSGSQAAPQAGSSTSTDIADAVQAVQIAADTSTEPITVSAAAESVADALANNQDTHTDADDFEWDDSKVVDIILNGDTILADGTGVTVEGSTATITAAGTYHLSGTLTDGQILIDSPDEKVVRLILDGVELASTTSAPIYAIRAEELILILADGSQNHLSDGDSYMLASAETDEPNAALFSAADLTISGNGSLTVDGNYNDGITSKDGLVITGGTITVEAADDGIRGKDYLVIEGGNITVTAQGDGLKADNEEDATRGYISIENGALQVTSDGDAITAQTDVLIAGGELTLTSGGGSSQYTSNATSAKGIKGMVSVAIDAGAFTIDAADDGIHSNGSIVINAGTYQIASGDDGMHADATLEINGGEITIAESYEGIESAVITLNGGEIHITASDDGVNVAGGNDGSGAGMRPGGGRGGDTFNYTGNYYLYINDGYVVVNANGDGLDSNGAIEMNGGAVLVNGPTQQMNGALDYIGGFKMNGGFLVAVGSAGMAQAPDSASSQASLLVNFSGTLKAGALIHIETEDGEEILTFAASKQVQSIAFSSPELENGATYQLYLGGSSSGSETDGLYQAGKYSDGEEYTSFTITDIVTMIGNSVFRGRP